MQVDVDGDALTLSVVTPSKNDAPAAITPGSDSAAAGDKPDAAADTGATAAAAEQKCTVHRRERGAAFAERTLRMPESADMERVSAELDLGVLTVSVPKRDDAVTKRRQVPIA
jgi:Hsp20/alpha crystallin family